MAVLRIGTTHFLEVVGIDPRKVRNIPENSKYLKIQNMHEIVCMKYAFF